MKKVASILLVAAAAIGVSAIMAFFYFSSNLPTMQQIASRRVSQSTKIYDRSGTVLLYEISNGQERTVVPLDQIPEYLRDATVAIEDENFYNEPAFDWKAILRAFLVNLIHGRILQGGSTITQQLAKNAFLASEQTLSRKIKELILAMQLDRQYSKDQILGLYLNEIPYGPTAYGVEAASETYFGKQVKDLNLAESALLAALPKAPTYYSPWGSHMKELLARQKLILKKMLDLGKIYQSDYDNAFKAKLVFAAQGQAIKAPHFVMAAEDYLTQKYGEEMVQQGGLSVITTLDWNLQQIAEKAVADGAAQNEKLYQGKNAALVAEDPKTGQILALVGSRDYFDTQNDGNFDVATQGLRQPGSSLKPFVYLTAFDKGYAPDTVLFDVPTEFTADDPACPPIPDFDNNTSGCFHPQDFENSFAGPVPLRNALAQSINIPAVKLLYLTGVGDSVATAYKFGLTTLTSPNLYGLSLVLGGGAVRLIDLVGAYSVLSQDGVKRAQSMILEVRDYSGNILESYHDRSEQVAGPQPVRLINSILSDADARTPLFQNSMNLTVFPGYDVALKTGTSNDYRDAWAIGYTPSFAAGVWAGNNDNSPMQRHGSSILAAVPIWHAFMSQALKNAPPETFNRPDPVTPSKPVLAGDYLHDKQIHTILYYVDRADPQGPPPQDPSADPQFTNWETGVLAWATQNIPDFQSYNQPVAQEAASSTFLAGPEAATQPPQIKIESPRAGTFIGGEINISANIQSASAISGVGVYWNKRLMREFPVPGNTLNYNLVWSFSPPSSAPQNLLEIEAANASGASGKTGVIIYAQ